MIVVDTSLISSLLIPGPFHVLAREAARQDQWCAPLLWRAEFGSVLARYLRRYGLRVDEAKELMRLAENLFRGREFPVPALAVLDCIHSSNLPAYDCEFVALAIDLGLSLVTMDEAIVSEFPHTAVHLSVYVRPKLKAKG